VFTSTNPSCTPLARTALATSGVMFLNAIFDGMFSVRYFVSDVIVSSNVASRP